MKKINVLEVIATLAIGGTPRQLLLLARYLDKTKYNLTLCCLTKGGPLLAEAQRLGIKVVILGKKFRHDLSVIPKLIRVIKREKIDLIHTYMFTSNTFGRLAAILARVPIIISSERNIEDWKGKFRLYVDKVLMRFTDKMLVNSFAVKDFLVQMAGIKSYKIAVIYNGLDLDRFHQKINVLQERRNLGLDSQVSVVGTVARICHYKGLHFLIRSIPQILDVFPQVKFLIVGNANLKPERIYKRKLKRLISGLGVSSSVIFTGFRRDIPRVMATFDLFALPSLREGFSNVLLEAMAMGKPVVATNVGGNPETITDGQTGILVPPKDPIALSEAIISLLKDRSRAIEMGKKGRRRVKENFGRERMVQETEKIYDHLIEKKFRPC
ncbi:D-inositol 3-phosphate glycosyltransferase [subsurface metagenome]